MPLNPESPDVDLLPRHVVGILGAVCDGSLDQRISSSPPLPSPTSLRFVGEEIECNDAKWNSDAGGLLLEVVKPLANPGPLGRLGYVMNEEALVVLEDGSNVHARLAHLVSHGEHLDFEKQTATKSFVIRLDSWTWRPHDWNCLWLGDLEETKLEDSNVLGEALGADRVVRLSNKHDFYIVQRHKLGTTRLVVDTRGTPLDQSVLGTEFMAMEFALGRPLRLGRLVAVDANLQPVGAAGLDFGGWSGRGRVGRCPVATERDLYANFDKGTPARHWIPVLFSQVAKQLHLVGPDAPLIIAVAAYVDSIGANNIHVSYLLVQVALEALCSSLVTPTTHVLVKKPKEWLEFAQQHKAEILALATDVDAGQKLMNKVESAQQAPTTGRVPLALKHLSLDVPRRALAEIPGRNRSAHDLVMAKESTADAQDLADRLATVQTLLVAVIAKCVDFRGPIIGWEWVSGRRKIPDWWPWETIDEARRMYVAAVDDEDGK